MRLHGIADTALAEDSAWEQRRALHLYRWPDREPRLAELLQSRDAFVTDCIEAVRLSGLPSPVWWVGGGLPFALARRRRLPDHQPPCHSGCHAPASS